jgi:uncharacterized protein YuzE
MAEFTYDKSSDAVYIDFGVERKGEISTDGDWPFNIDIDEEGQVVGLEIMDAASVLNQEYLGKMKRIDGRKD